MTEKKQLRYARKPITSTGLLLKDEGSWLIKIKNLSASGLFIITSSTLELKQNDHCQIEMKLDENEQLIIDVVVSRVAEDGYGLKFTNLPLDKQIPLWEILGPHVDIIEK